MAVNYFLLFGPFVFVGLFFGLAALFVRKKFRMWWARFKHREKALDVIILTKNKNLYHGVVPVNNDKFRYKEQDYIIDNKAIYVERFRVGFRPYSMYIQGNPKPIKFDFDKFKPDISSVDFKEFIQSDLIRKLLETKEEKMVMLLLLISGVTIVISLVIAFFVIKRTDMILDGLNQIKGVIIR